MRPTTPRPVASSRMAELAAELNRQSADTRRHKTASHAQWDEAQKATLAQTKQYGRHQAAAPRRQGGYKPSTSAPAPGSSSRAKAAGRVIDTIAVYNFRNHRVRREEVAAPAAQASAPRTFAALGAKVYGDHSPSFLISSSGRGGAA